MSGFSVLLLVWIPFVSVFSFPAPGFNSFCLFSWVFRLLVLIQVALFNFFLPFVLIHFALFDSFSALALISLCSILSQPLLLFLFALLNPSFSRFRLRYVLPQCDQHLCRSRGHWPIMHRRPVLSLAVLRGSTVRGYSWLKQNVFIHRNHKYNKQVPETQKQYVLFACYV